MMTKTVFGLIAAVMVLAMAGCDGGGMGTGGSGVGTGGSDIGDGGPPGGSPTLPKALGKLTITGIPSEYNNKYINVARGYDGSEAEGMPEIVLGYAGLSGSSATLVRIADAKAVVPLYSFSTARAAYEAYAGNHQNVPLVLEIYASATLNISSPTGTKTETTSLVHPNFSNGNATVEWLYNGGGVDDWFPAVQSNTATAWVGSLLYATVQGGLSSSEYEYQWNKGKTAIDGATEQNYMPAEVGSYTVTVTRVKALIDDDDTDESEPNVSRTSAAIKVALAEDVTVSVDVSTARRFYHGSLSPYYPSRYTYRVHLTMQLSEGTWKLSPGTNDPTQDLIAAAKSCVSISGENWYEYPDSVGHDIYHGDDALSIFWYKDIEQSENSDPPSGYVSITLYKDKLEEMKAWINMSGELTVPANGSTGSSYYRNPY